LATVTSYKADVSSVSQSDDEGLTLERNFHPLRIYSNLEAFVGKLRNYQGLILDYEDVRRNMRAVEIEEAQLIVEWQVFNIYLLFNFICTRVLKTSGLKVNTKFAFLTLLRY